MSGEPKNVIRGIEILCPDCREAMRQDGMRQERPFFRCENGKCGKQWLWQSWGWQLIGQDREKP